MNNCAFIGRLARDPESKVTPSGKTVVSFTIAVERRDRDKNVDFIPCNAWDKTGEIVATYLVKGDQVGITGSLEVRTYEKDGEKRTAFDILVRSVDLLGSKKTETKTEPAPTPAPPLLAEAQLINSEGYENDATLPFDII